MKKTVSIVLVSLIVLSAFSIFAPHAKAEPDGNPLDVAEKAAVWIMDEAIPEGNGYKWEHYGARGGLFYQSSVSSGAAGMGMFFLALYERTGVSLYLDYAEGAATWVISQAVPSGGGYYWLSPDDDLPSGWRLSPNVAGIGDFFLKMYRTTMNATYLAYAEGAATWLIAMAEYESGGYFIPYNPPGKYGSQAAHGIMPGREAYTVTFLLHLYEETGNTNYRTYVEEMADWLILGPDIREENGGYKWENDRPYYVSGGYPIATAAQIAVYFYESYQVFGNETYLHYANGAIQWILSQAVVEDANKVKWPRRQGVSDYPLTFGDKLLSGLSVVGDVLLLGYSVTSNSTYLDYAEKNANWIISQGTPEAGGYKFHNAKVNALIYRFLRELYNTVGNATYSGYAGGVLTWIVNNATVTDGGYKWRTLTYYPYYPTWFGGAAGIGYHLISAPVPAFQASYSTNLPVIDGSATDPEWNDANSYEISLSEYQGVRTISARVYFKHDGTNIYMGLKVFASQHNFDQFIVYFDEGDDGGYGSGTRDGVLTSNQEDLKACFSPAISGYTIEDGCYKEGAWYGYWGGDFTAECNFVVDHWEVEFSIPFTGNDGETDDVSDLVCAMTDTIGIKIQYFTQPGAVNYYYPMGGNHDIETYTTLSFEVPLTKYAILVAPVRRDSEAEYKHNIHEMRLILLDSGWTDDDIIFLTRSDMAKQETSEPWIDGDATYENVEKALNALAFGGTYQFRQTDGSLGPAQSFDASMQSDIVFIELRDHGAHLTDGQRPSGSDPNPNDESDGMDGVFCTYEWNDRTFNAGNYWYDDEFDAKLDAIKYNKMVLLVDACHSGEFIPDCEDANRLILTSSAEDELSGRYAYKFYERIRDPNADGYGGGETNGIISCEEAHYYAVSQITGQHPQISDNILDEVYLDPIGDFSPPPVSEDIPNDSPFSGSILVNEFFYNLSNVQEQCQWVEIYNPTDTELDISGWILGFDLIDGVNIFPEGTVIGPSEYITVTHALETFQNWFTVPPGVLVLDDDSMGNNFGAPPIDTLALYDQNLGVVDDLDYGGGPGRAPAAIPPNSISRYKDSYDTDNAEMDWYVESVPTPGSASSVERSPTTIESCDSSGAKKDTFGLVEDVYAKGSGYSPSTAYDIYVVEDVATWTDGMAIPSRVSGTVLSVSSDASGDISATLVWSDPLVVGKYDIVVDVDGDGFYNQSRDALDDSDIEVTAGFNVIPEVPLGTIMASAAMIIALVAYVAVPKWRRKREYANL